MGAFGELLDKHFGGTIHDVSTWGKSQPKKSNKEIGGINRELDKTTFEVYTQSCKKRLEQAEQMFKMFETNKFESGFRTEEYKEKFTKWKEKFIAKSIRSFKNGK